MNERTPDTLFELFDMYNVVRYNNGLELLKT